MEEVKLTKEQEILFEIYDKGVQNEECDLDAYVEKMKQALSIANVSDLCCASCGYQMKFDKNYQNTNL